jgi:tRNA-dihydrouridine synthase
MGVDDAAEYEDLVRFVESVTTASGIARVTVHARAALLGGISPAANRSVPPLRHACVHALKADFPRLAVTLNGGVDSLAAARVHLAQGLDGVMIGRAIQRNPLLLTRVDTELYGAPAAEALTPAAVIAAYQAYVDGAVAAATAAAAAGDAPAFAPAQVRQRAGRHLGIAAVAREARRAQPGGGSAGDPVVGRKRAAEGDTDAAAPCEEADA